MRRMARRLANKKRKGFTLVELIVVIAILAILAVGAVVAFGNILETAEENTARANASVIVRAVNTYNSLVSNSTYAIAYGSVSGLTTVSDFNGLFDESKLIITMDLSIDASDAEFVAAKAFIESGGTVGLKVKD